MFYYIAIIILTIIFIIVHSRILSLYIDENVKLIMKISLSYLIIFAFNIIFYN